MGGSSEETDACLVCFHGSDRLPQVIAHQGRALFSARLEDARLRKSMAERKTTHPVKEL